VHDWLTGRRGAEKVLEEILRLVPGAEVYTLVWRRGAVPLVEARARAIRPSVLNRLPAVWRYFQLFLPLFNRIVRRWRFDGYDLVVSVSHCAAKNVRPPSGIPHLCYCHTPVRYAWDLFEIYSEPFLGRTWARPLRGAAHRIRDHLRAEDVEGARGVTHFLAISEFIRDRIRRCYGCDAQVIYPPVDVVTFREECAAHEPGERFLALSALRGNKRVQEIARAFAGLALPLDIVGACSRRGARRLARLGGGYVRVHGHVPDEMLYRFVGQCRALVHAATEDFGLAPVEAMAAGRPVIGYGGCGVAETVVDAAAGRTGVLFADPTSSGIADAVRRFLEVEPSIRSEDCRRRAAEFSRQRFQERFAAALHTIMPAAQIEI
jgi:glycosyltransferase involved in cell wall biosynthesis